MSNILNITKLRSQMFNCHILTVGGKVIGLAFTTWPLLVVVGRPSLFSVLVGGFLGACGDSCDRTWGRG